MRPFPALPLPAALAVLSSHSVASAPEPPPAATPATDCGSSIWSSAAGASPPPLTTTPSSTTRGKHPSARPPRRITYLSSGFQPSPRKSAPGILVNRSVISPGARFSISSRSMNSPKPSASRL